MPTKRRVWLVLAACGIALAGAFAVWSSSTSRPVRFVRFENGTGYPYAKEQVLAVFQLKNRGRDAISFDHVRKTPEHVCYCEVGGAWYKIPKTHCCHGRRKVYLGRLVAGDHTLKPGATWEFPVPVNITNVPFKIVVEGVCTNRMSPHLRRFVKKWLPPRNAEALTENPKTVLLESEPIVYGDSDSGRVPLTHTPIQQPIQPEGLTPAANGIAFSLF